MRGATATGLEWREILSISIHTPHAGSDLCNHQRFWKYLQFQSTLPMRGATGVEDEKIDQIIISIHTPHAGSDDTKWRNYKMGL